MSNDTASSAAFDELSKPFLTTDPNIRSWLRNRRKAAFFEARAAESLKGTARMSHSPWTAVRPANVDDVIPGAVLWEPVDGRSLGGGKRYRWHYVERLNDEPDAVAGSFVNESGDVRRVDGLYAEESTAEAVEKAEGLEKIIGGSRDSALGSVYGMLCFGGRNRGSGSLKVSAEFYEKLNEEARSLDLTMAGNDVVSLFGISISVGDNLEHGAMEFTSRGEGDCLFNPEGLTLDDLERSNEANQRGENAE